MNKTLRVAGDVVYFASGMAGWVLGCLAPPVCVICGLAAGFGTKYHI